MSLGVTTKNELAGQAPIGLPTSHCEIQKIVEAVGTVGYSVRRHA
jgi:hypothetical protein